MPFTIVRNDITQMTVDAVVNTANPRPIVGAGVDAMIYKKAGIRLRAARQKIGVIPVGSAAITPAYRLDAQYVIHTVGPVWRGGNWDEEAQLRSCYENSLELAVKHQCKSIAFPLIAAGNYGFPKDRALQIAISVFSAFLLEQEMQIYLVVFDRTSFQLSEKLFEGIASYIDEHYVDACNTAAFDAALENRRIQAAFYQEWEPAAPGAMECEPEAAQAMGCEPEASRAMECEQEVVQAMEWEPETSRAMEYGVCYSQPSPKVTAAVSLEEMLKQADAGFSETLLRMIDKTGKKDSEIYKRANLSKQHFSKIRNNPNYKPTKQTAIALAIALELDLEETRDLIGRAGFALTNSSKFDLIIRYFIQLRIYNIVEINCVLFEHDQSLLGG